MRVELCLALAPPAAAACQGPALGHAAQVAKKQTATQHVTMAAMRSCGSSGGCSSYLVPWHMQGCLLQLVAPGQHCIQQGSCQLLVVWLLCGGVERRWQTLASSITAAAGGP